MGIVLRYVQETSSGWRYRRRVPDQLRGEIGKGEIVRRLGASKSEAIARYSSVHTDVERLFARARAIVAARGSELGEPRIDTPYEAFQCALGVAHQMGFDPNGDGFGLEDDDGEQTEVLVAGRYEVVRVGSSEENARDMTVEAIGSRYRIDPSTGHPTGLSLTDTQLIRILQSVGGPPPPPAMTIVDAARFYIREKLGGAADAQRNEARIERVCAIVLEALGRNPELRSLRKDDARKVRDYMLKTRDVRPTTVNRYLNDVRAFVNYAIDHNDLSGVTNVFRGVAAQAGGSRRDDRRSFTAAELTETRRRVLTHANSGLQLIWRLLEGTGCRLGEIAGLLYEDVQLREAISFIQIQHHEHRRLKSDSSKRRVPLVGDALDAAREALAAAQPGLPLFSRYGRFRGPDAASQALMKQVRSVTSDRRLSVHSLRHVMKDRLDLAGVPTAVQSLIMGHASRSIAEDYGGPEARLRTARDAIAKALSVDLGSVEKLDT